MSERSIIDELLPVVMERIRSDPQFYARAKAAVVGDSEMLPVLYRWLCKSGDPEELKLALSGLRQMGAIGVLNPMILKVLRDALTQDRFATLREEVAHTIECGGRTAIRFEDMTAQLLVASHDLDEDVRIAVLAALSFGNNEPEVRKRLQEIARTDKSPSVRQSAQNLLPGGLLTRFPKLAIQLSAPILVWQQGMQVLRASDTADIKEDKQAKTEWKYEEDGVGMQLVREASGKLFWEGWTQRIEYAEQHVQLQLTLRSNSDAENQERVSHLVFSSRFAHIDQDIWGFRVAVTKIPEQDLRIVEVSVHPSD